MVTSCYSFVIRSFLIIWLRFFVKNWAFFLQYQEIFMLSCWFVLRIYVLKNAGGKPNLSLNFRKKFHWAALGLSPSLLKYSHFFQSSTPAYIQEQVHIFLRVPLSFPGRLCYIICFLLPTSTSCFECALLPVLLQKLWRWDPPTSTGAYRFSPLCCLNSHL